MSIVINYQNNNQDYIFNSFDQIDNFNEVIVINCYSNKLSELPELPDSL